MNQFADFLKVYKADELDLVRAVSVADATYSELMRKYEDHLKNIERPSDLHFISDNKIITEILTPAGINSFLQATQQYEVNRKYSWETGIIISCLLQNSYNYGYNDFYLNTKALSNISNLGACVIGTEDNPLSVAVQGDIESNLGHGAQYSNFNLSGTVGDLCGSKARYSSFSLDRSVGERCGKGAIYCTFKTSVWENVEKIRGNLSGFSNTLIYINNGKEVRII